MDTIENFHRLGRVLFQDYRFAKEATRAGDAVQARALFRAAFALIEGVTAALKSVILTQVENSDDRQFSTAEIAMLREEAYRLDGAKVKSRPNWPQTTDNIQFAVACFAKLRGCEFELNRSLTGWMQLADSVVIRNQVTHPKTIEDLEITDAQVEALKQAVEWFDSETRRMIYECEVLPRDAQPDNAADEASPRS